MHGAGTRTRGSRRGRGTPAISHGSEGRGCGTPPLCGVLAVPGPQAVGDVSGTQVRVCVAPPSEQGRGRRVSSGESLGQGSGGSLGVTARAPDFASARGVPGPHPGRGTARGRCAGVSGQLPCHLTEPHRASPHARALEEPRAVARPCGPQTHPWRREVSASWGWVEHSREGHAQLVEGSGTRPGAPSTLWIRSFWGRAPVGSRARGGDGRREGLPGGASGGWGCPAGWSRSSSDSGGPRGRGRAPVRAGNGAAGGDRDLLLRGTR